MNRLSALISLFAWGCAVVALARDADGVLDVILTPNNGRPAVLTPGAALEIHAAAEGEARLAGDGGNVPLDISWTDGTGTCVLPESIAPGVYALEMGGDRVSRAVHVRESVPGDRDSYRFLHIADPRAGTYLTDSVFERTLAGAGDAAFVLVTGALTHDGSPEAYRAMIAALDTSPLPTFVADGGPDGEAWFGPAVYHFRFGADGYLGFMKGNPDAMTNTAYGHRRAIRAARWSVGFAPRYRGDLDPRLQLTLFVDDQLDYLVTGMDADTATAKTVPWFAPQGATRLVVTPARAALVTSGPAGVKALPLSAGREE